MTWRHVQLGEVCEFKYGKSLAAGKRDGGKYSVYGSNGAVGSHSVALTDGPAIIVGRKGSFGEVAYSPDPCWPIDTTYYIDSSATKADLKWLTYRLRRLGLTSLNRAAAIPGLNREDAYRQVLLLPPIDEQRRIASILDRADALRRMRQAAILETKALLQSAFNTIGMNDTSLRCLPLGEVVDKVIDYRGKSPRKCSAGVPLVTAGLIKNGTILRAKEFVAEADYVAWMRRGLPMAGDVLFTSEAPLGELAQVTDPRIALAQRIILLRGKEEVINNTFLMHALMSPSVRRQILQRSTGSTVKGIRQSELLKVELSVPATSVQAQFSAQVASMERLRHSLEVGHRRLDALFASLEFRAFSDQL